VQFVTEIQAELIQLNGSIIGRELLNTGIFEIFSLKILALKKFYT